MVIGFTAGAFDLLHAGHVNFLSDCKQRCDILFVGLHTDPSIDRPKKNRPVQSTYERYIQLKGLSSVSHIIPYDTERDLINILACEKINIRFLGSDYIDNKEYTGYKLCEDLNIKIEYIHRFHNYSSSELRERVYDAESMSMGP